MRIFYVLEVIVFHQHRREDAYADGVIVVTGRVVVVVGVRLTEQDAWHPLIGIVGEPVVMIGYLVLACVGSIMFRASAVQADHTVRIIRIGVKELVP